MTTKLIRDRIGTAHAHLREAGRRLEHLREAGMSTAEYAVGIMAAATFALVLLGIVKSDGVRSALSNIVSSALGLAG